jgi:nucleotide-binding universal stress UspA family protein
VLVPIANPASAASLVDVAATLRTPGTGRVLLLSVIRVPDGESDPHDVLLRDAREVLGESLERSLERNLIAETLFTLATDAWGEIARVARGHGCETVLVGLPEVTGHGIEGKLEGLLAGLDVDAVILRAPHRWRMADAHRVLVPIGGRRDQSHLRARLLASLSRSRERALTYFHTLPADAPDASRRRVERDLRLLARDEAAGPYEVVVERTDDAHAAIVQRAAEADVVVMGTQRRGRGKPQIGELPLAIARETRVPLVLISRRPSRPFELPVEMTGTAFLSS